MSDGGNLREQLEGALQRIKEQEQKLREYEVREVAGTSDFHLVTPDDLAQVDGDLREAAASIQKQKLDQQKQLLSKAGLSDDDIAKVIAGEKLEASSSHPGASLARHQSGTGQVPPKVDDARLHGRSAVRAYFAEEAND